MRAATSTSIPPTRSFPCSKEIWSGKQIELLTEIVPQRPRVAVLWNPPPPAHTTLLKALEGTARAAGIQLHPVAVHRPDDFDGVFSAMRTGQAKALMICSSALHTQHLWTIVGLARKHRLPAVAWERMYAEGGLLMTYGPNAREILRRAACYVDRVLKGAKPADLPVGQPTTFEPVINLKTAQALGLGIPPSLLGLRCRLSSRQVRRPP
jgi:putative tryptophan/tyrosine transport system substrate-binding protein